MTLFVDQQGFRRMWCRGRNEKKGQAIAIGWRMNSDGKPPAKIWDTWSFCRVSVTRRKSRWLTVSCHPGSMFPFIASKSFQALICVEKLHNLSESVCGLFFISVFLKKPHTHNMMYFSVSEADWVFQSDLALQGWVSCGGWESTQDELSLCLPGEAWMGWGNLASNSCHVSYWKELSSDEYPRAFWVSMAFLATNLVRSWVERARKRAVSI